MKTTLRYILTVFLAFSLLSFEYSIDDVVSAIKTGDASRMSRYFDNLVEITLHERSHSYSKSQAEVILRDFFVNSGVKNFKVVHKGASNDSEFCVGSLTTRGGEYRTTIFMKTRGDKKVLQELRFESQHN
jgi:Domain of unknown function (DUF4783)